MHYNFYQKLCSPFTLILSGEINVMFVGQADKLLAHVQTGYLEDLTKFQNSFYKQIKCISDGTLGVRWVFLWFNHRRFDTEWIINIIVYVTCNHTQNKNVSHVLAQIVSLTIYFQYVKKEIIAYESSQSICRLVFLVYTVFSTFPFNRAC